MDKRLLVAFLHTSADTSVLDAPRFVLCCAIIAVEIVSCKASVGALDKTMEEQTL